MKIISFIRFILTCFNDEEITTPDEEDTKLDLDKEPVIPEAETTITEMANTAIFANSRATGKRNAGRG